MSVRKRSGTNRDGSQGEASVVAYGDQGGKRHIKTFDRTREANAFHASVSTEVRFGVHVPDSQSVTVAEAGLVRLKSCEASGHERSTQYEAPRIYRALLDLPEDSVGPKFREMIGIGLAISEPAIATIARASPALARGPGRPSLAPMRFCFRQRRRRRRLGGAQARP
jgi:hypothetical protein